MGTQLRVDLRPDQLTLSIEAGPGPLRLGVRGKVVEVAVGAPVTVPLDGQGPRLAGDPPNPAGTMRADGTVISATVPGGED